MKKALIVVGPTAIGKTKLAFSIAPFVSGVLVNADSIQVYKGLDIISGKDIPQDSKFVKKTNVFNLRKDIEVGYFLRDNSSIYLLDLVDSSYRFSIYDWLTIAIPVIEYIEKIGKLPIVVGGTGFYVKSLLDGIETIHIPPNKKIRGRLQSFTVLELQRLLESQDFKKFQKMNDSDRKNKRRLIRAIEIDQFNENNKLSSKTKKLEGFEPLIIGLTASREVVKKRIDDRVEKRIKMRALDEARTLFERYNNLSNQIKTANGYKQLFEYLMAKYSLNEAIERWRFAEYLNAKKQMTWFRKDKRIMWFDVTERGFEDRIKEHVKEWLQKI